jgi:hypothetical protein
VPHKAIYAIMELNAGLGIVLELHQIDLFEKHDAKIVIFFGE